MHAARRRRSETGRNLTIAFGVFALVAAVAVGGLWLVGKTTATGPFACAGFDFDRDEWRAAAPKQRREDARLISRCEFLVGKSRERVRAELGKPEREPDGGSDWRFFLGRQKDYLRLGNADHLLVRFNDSGRVRRAEVPD